METVSEIVDRIERARSADSKAKIEVPRKVWKRVHQEIARRATVALGLKQKPPVMLELADAVREHLRQQEAAGIPAKGSVPQRIADMMDSQAKKTRNKRRRSRQRAARR